MSNEFSRPFRIDTLGEQPRAVSIEAEPGEREKLARRFGLVSVDALSAQARIARNGEAVTASGRLAAEVVQSCVATGEPVPARIEEEFRIEFRAQPELRTEDEIELGESELDVVFYDGAAVDLGEAAAETLALALDPWPRSPGAESVLREAGVKSEDEAKAESSPFAVLAGLKGKKED